MPNIEVDQETYDELKFASNLTGVSISQIVGQLVAQSRTASATSEELGGKPDTVPIHSFYEGHHTEALYYRRGGRIEILTGSLAGRTFKTPSEAAKEVVTLYNPDVTANRNGWTFWVITETKAPLQSIRYDDI
jgi:hypothetical protein